MNDRIVSTGPLAPAGNTVGATIVPASATQTFPEALQSLLDLAFDRTYLAQISALEGAPSLLRLEEPAIGHSEDAAPSPIAWRRVERLPVQPAPGADDYLLLRWQRMLTTLHAWHRRFVMVLLRTGDRPGGERSRTELFFGIRSLDGRRGKVSDINADVQLEQAVAGEMAGLRLERLSSKLDDATDKWETWEFQRQLERPLERLKACGAITGLPSPFAVMSGARSWGNDQDFESGLGRLARGLKGPRGRDCTYAVVIVADAVPDPAISVIIDRLRKIGESIHPLIRTTEQESHSKGRSEVEQARSMRQHFQRFAHALMPAATAATTVAVGAATGATAGLGALAVAPALIARHFLSPRPNISETSGSSVGSERVDMVAQHCKLVVERHIERLMRGRSIGFWNSGIYVLGDTDNTVSTVCGMLRASYSGAASQIEPLRAIVFPQHLEAAKIVREFRHIPFPAAAASSEGKDTNGDGTAREWHLLGELYQHVSTPLTTEELSLATELPRKDAPGLRTAKNLVRFALNGPVLPDNANPITLGKLMSSGAVESGDYRFDLNSLVRHGLLVGTTGSGKSTTCRRLIEEATRAGVSFLIIEPVKDDYARWAVEQNKSLPDDKKIAVYMPGTDDFNGMKVEPLRLNPFEPACRKNENGKPLRQPDVLGRLERVASILNASMPMQEVLPILLEKAVMSLGTECFGQGLEEWPSDGNFALLQHLKKWARLDLFGGAGDAARYDANVRANLFAALESRVDALTRGRRGQVLNVKRSTPPEILFERPGVVNLSRFGGEADRALVMALLLVGLCEYRMDFYATDRAYESDARHGRLFHLAIVEEAHTVLRRPEPTLAGSGNPQALVARMFSDMLAEVRQYGQGLLVIDQDPSQLIAGTIKNTSFRIAHKLPHQEDRAALATSMILTAEQAGFLAVLPPGQAVILTEHDDAPCWIKIDAPKH